MQRLLSDFDDLFDLDYLVHGRRLGDLVTAALDHLEANTSPEWGSPGPKDRYQSDIGLGRDFYYAPHLFPEMEPRLRLAHKLQFHMLPREVPPEAPLSIAAVLESYCHLSGDLFGWESLSDGRFLLWILDLSGHGIRAGLASAMVKVLIDNLRRRGHVDLLVAELNDLLFACLRDRASNLFATGFFMSVGRDGSALFASAGHPPVLLRRANGAIEELSSNGLPVGLFQGSPYSPDPVRLRSGDTLLLYTDGVPEATDKAGNPFGLERLRSFLEPNFETPRALTDALYRKLSGHQDMALLNDDVTFVAARMP